MEKKINTLSVFLNLAHKIMVILCRTGRDPRSPVESHLHPLVSPAPTLIGLGPR